MSKEPLRAQKNNVGVPITTVPSTRDGFEVARGNIYHGATVMITHEGPVPLSPRVRRISPHMVMAGAGAH